VARRAQRLNLARAQVTDDMHEAIVGGRLRPTEALRAVRSWWSHRETPWAIVSGPRDVGKSVAAAALLAEHDGLWMSSNEVVQAFAGMFGESLAQQARAKGAGLLTIDELGVEDDPARMLGALLQLLNARASTRRTPVLATTNLTLELLLRRYPEPRLQSRINELVTWVPVHGESLRPSRPRMLCPSAAQAAR